VETAALFLEFEYRLNELIGSSDFVSIEKLINNRTFATRVEEWIEKNPDTAATNITTFIDKIDNRFLPGMRQHYDYLSERCHPNSLGHFFFFGTLDTKSGTTTFSDSKELGLNLRHIMPAALLIPFVENSMERLDATIEKLADAHFRAQPPQ